MISSSSIHSETQRTTSAVLRTGGGGARYFERDLGPVRSNVFGYASW